MSPSTFKRGRRLSPLLIVALLAAPGPDYRQIADKAAVDGPVHDGVEIQIDLPTGQHVRNFGAPADGKGLCVFASMTMAGRWHNVRLLFDVIHKVNEVGGWPEKVDRVFKANTPDLKYVQYEGTDPSILDKALSEGRIACVTCGYGERYQMETIYHMVCLVHLDADRAAIPISTAARSKPLVVGAFVSFTTPVLHTTDMVDGFADRYI